MDNLQCPPSHSSTIRCCLFTRRYVSSTSVLWRSQVRHPLAAVVVRPLVRARDDVHRRHPALPPGIWRESLLETVIPERAEKWFDWDGGRLSPQLRRQGS
jgi:hypothetical protein